jgi:hypothetical protein
MWGQPLARLEIMKFDVLKEDKLVASMTDKTEEGHVPKKTALYGAGPASPTSPFADRRHFLEELLSSGRGVDVTGFCRIHEGVPLEPVEYIRPVHAPSDGSDIHRPVVNGAVGVCHRCTTEGEHHDLVPQTRIDCVYCWEPVVGMYSPCLACGCILHDACMAEWHVMGGAECPLGHECHCVEEASSASRGTWAGLRAAVLLAGGSGGGDTERERSRYAGGHEGDSSTARSTKSTSARSRRKSAPADAAKFGHMLRRTYTNETSSSRSGTEGGYGTEGTRPGGSSARRRGQDDGDIDSKTDRESSVMPSGHRGIPFISAAGMGMGMGMAGGLLAGVKPPPRGEEPISAAQLSLGKRLKRQLELEESGRPGVARRNSGGLAMWSKSHNGNGV